MQLRAVNPRTGSSRAFTLIEMLVVISIIMILAGMILPALGRARFEARKVKCLGQLKQMGVAILIYADAYGEGGVESFPPWITLLGQSGGKQSYIPDGRVFICPEDGTDGREGGRPDDVRYQGASSPIEQFEMADIDSHTGPLDGSSSRKNKATGGVNCSYIFEYSGEPCDWLYIGRSAPISGAGDVPSGYEWQWGTQPDWTGFLALCDRDKNGILSWNEVKKVSREGSKDHGLPGWNLHVPILRCYWHIGSDRRLRDDSVVVDLAGDANSAYDGVPPWYK
jgi:prepilin-type N-terminal cleavage/methylation domain-containing protein